MRQTCTRVDDLFMARIKEYGFMLGIDWDVIVLDFILFCLGIIGVVIGIEAGEDVKKVGIVAFN